MRKKIEPSSVQITFYKVKSIKPLVTIDEDDPLWAYFMGYTGQKPDPIVNSYVRLYIPITAHDSHVNKIVEWIKLTNPSPKIMPRRTSVAPVLKTEQVDTESLRTIAQRHTLEVWHKVYGANHHSTKEFTDKLETILNKAGL